MRIFFKARGFTLIELMTVIAIIGILATIITTSLVSSRAKGRDAKRVSDIKTLQLALETYYNDNASFPATLSVLAPTYLPNVPLDPKDNTSPYKYTTWNSSNSQICTTGLNLPIGYHLGAALEDTTNTALKQDRNLTARVSTTDCGGTADFDGNSAAVTVFNVYSCGTSPVGIGGAAACYDVTN